MGLVMGCCVEMIGKWEVGERVKKLVMICVRNMGWCKGVVRWGERNGCTMRISSGYIQ